MNFLGRDLSDYAKNIFRLPQYLMSFYKCFLKFKHPFEILHCYFTKTPPKQMKVCMRSGLTIFLSDYPFDLITVYMIFAKGEYGHIPPESTIIDIGANIGAFSLYAAAKGARKVYAFEPSRGAFATLKRNITENNLSEVIVPYQLAVYDNAGGMIRFPVRSDVANVMLKDDQALEESDNVPTITLEKIIETNEIETVDVLKMDCEGAEYDILYSTKDRVFSKIKNIRMEYHKGNPAQLIRFMEQRNLHLIRMVRTSKTCGNAWFSQRLSTG